MLGGRLRVSRVLVEVAPLVYWNPQNRLCKFLIQLMPSQYRLRRSLPLSFRGTCLFCKGSRAALTITKKSYINADQVIETLSCYLKQAGSILLLSVHATCLSRFRSAIQEYIANDYSGGSICQQSQSEAFGSSTNPEHKHICQNRTPKDLWPVHYIRCNRCSPRHYNTVWVISTYIDEVGKDTLTC